MAHPPAETRRAGSRRLPVHQDAHPSPTPACLSSVPVREIVSGDQHGYGLDTDKQPCPVGRAPWPQSCDQCELVPWDQVGRGLDLPPPTPSIAAGDGRSGTGMGGGPPMRWPSAPHDPSRISLRSSPTTHMSQVDALPAFASGCVEHVDPAFRCTMCHPCLRSWNRCDNRKLLKDRHG